MHSGGETWMFSVNRIYPPTTILWDGGSLQLTRRFAFLGSTICMENAHDEHGGPDLPAKIVKFPNDRVVDLSSRLFLDLHKSNLYLSFLAVQVMAAIHRGMGYLQEVH